MTPYKNVAWWICFVLATVSTHTGKADPCAPYIAAMLVIAGVYELSEKLNRSK